MAGTQNLLCVSCCRLTVNFIRMPVLIMRRVRHFADVDHRQQRENESLNEGHENTQKRKDQGHDEMGERRCKVRDLSEYLFVREHVGEQPYSKRERSDRARDQL